MKWELKTVSIEELTENEDNPRRILKEQAKHLRTSIEKFGVCQPIVANRSGKIIGGHQRFSILKTMGRKRVDVYVPTEELSSAEEKELAIRLNKNTGEWDYDILANRWDMDDLLEYGFQRKELEIEEEEYAAEDDLSEPPENPRTKIGDLYVLGEHRLMCGDSTKPDDVNKLIGKDIPILMVTDPPYGVEYDPAWRKEVRSCTKNLVTDKIKNDDITDWSAVWRLFPGSVAYVWHASKSTSTVQESLEKENFEVVSLIIWAKRHFSISRGDYHWMHEPCWYAVKKGCKHNWQGSRKETTLWEIAHSIGYTCTNTEDDHLDHSTQKPLECMRRPIVNNTAKGQGVYDPFAGSGTTLIAAQETDRKSYNMEIEPRFCDMTVERWIAFMGKNGKEIKLTLNGKPIKW